MKTSVPQLILVLALLGGCAGVLGNDSGPQVVNAASVERLYGRDWDLKGLTVDGRQTVMDVGATMTITFGPKGHVAGFGGVNRFTGAYKLSPEGKLTWGESGFATTRKMGPPEIMDKERDYLIGLSKVNVAIVAKHTLLLQSDDGSTVLSFDETGY